MKKKKKRGAFAVVALAAALWCGTGASWGMPDDNRPGIDPEAKKIIKALSEQSLQVQRVKIKVFDTIEEILQSGQMVEYGHVRSAVISKPDKLWIESLGDRTNTTLWNDGRLFTLLDRDQNVYVQLDAAGTIEQAVDMIYENYGISTPLADMLSTDIYAVLMNRARTCRYLGLHHAGETICHHIAATQDDIDWQIWIDQGSEPRLRKIVIIYKQVPGSPRYTAVLAEYKELDKVSEAAFAFQLPPGAEKIKPVSHKKVSGSRLKKAGSGGQ